MKNLLYYLLFLAIVYVMIDPVTEHFFKTSIKT